MTVHMACIAGRCALLVRAGSHQLAGLLLPLPAAAPFVMSQEGDFVVGTRLGRWIDHTGLSLLVWRNQQLINVVFVVAQKVGPWSHWTKGDTFLRSNCSPHIRLRCSIRPGAVRSGRS